jgi:hypothetical protein
VFPAAPLTHQRTGDSTVRPGLGPARGGARSAGGARRGILVWELRIELAWCGSSAQKWPGAGSHPQPMVHHRRRALRLPLATAKDPHRGASLSSTTNVSSYGGRHARASSDGCREKTVDGGGFAREEEGEAEDDSGSSAGEGWHAKMKR